MSQRKPLLGDWTVCQDKDTVKSSIRTNSIDQINQFDLYDWAIADFRNGKETPYIYVPNRVYPMDTVILKPTLEGLMPIPENMDGNCTFETASNVLLSAPYQSTKYHCDVSKCAYMPPISNCYAPDRVFDGPNCTIHNNASVVPLGVVAYGITGHIIFRVQAQSAFEFLDVRITNWPQAGERDAMGWPPGESPGENFSYTALGNNVFRIWAFPGGGRNGGWGPAGTDAKIKVVFTVGGGDGVPNLFGADFPGWNRQVTVSYVGAGRRGNHR